jgi:PEGA domain-containing protein
MRSAIFGLVVFDPYWWWDPGTADAAPPVENFQEAGPRPTGGLQLDVDPRRALVYVDGRFAGTVDDFSGYFKHLEIPAGTHIIEFVAPNYEPLLAELLVAPGRTTTFRMSLNRAPGRD